jgi:cytochrome c oxidase subunit 2
MAHFRSQMNVVPGLPTQFTFTPTISTKEMREIRGDREFDYYIVCNKICGNAHFNMKLKIVVEDEKSYQEWLDSQTGIFVKDTEPEPTEESEESEVPTEEPAVALN